MKTLCLTDRLMHYHTPVLDAILQKMLPSVCYYTKDILPFHTLLEDTYLTRRCLKTLELKGLVESISPTYTFYKWRITENGIHHISKTTRKAYNKLPNI